VTRKEAALTEESNGQWVCDVSAGHHPARRPDAGRCLAY
jgi:hypothetical protein